MKRFESSPMEAAQLPTFSRLVCEYLLNEGYQETDIFSGLSFTLSDFSDEAFRLSATEHVALIRRAVELTENPHIGLALKEAMTDPRSGAVPLLFMTAGRISKSLRLIAHYSQLFTRTLSVYLEERGTLPVFSVETFLDDHLVRYVALSSFSLFVDHLFHDALADRHLIVRVELAVPEPEGFDEVSEQFGFALEFNCDHTIIYFDRSLIDEPLQFVDPQTTRLIAEVCERQLVELNAEASAVGALKALIVRNIAAPPTLEQSASTLGVSSRSLRRRLQQEGSTFGSVLVEARKELAIRLLLESDEAVSSIGYQIGFEHPTHFGRAFKKWTGQSPTQFRQSR